MEEAGVQSQGFLQPGQIDVFAVLLFGFSHGFRNVQLKEYNQYPMDMLQNLQGGGGSGGPGKGKGGSGGSGGGGGGNRVFRTFKSPYPGLKGGHGAYGGQQDLNFSAACIYPVRPRTILPHFSHLFLRNADAQLLSVFSIVRLLLPH